MNTIINDKQFDKYKMLIYDKLGIHITESKREMVRSKVSKLMRANNIDCFDEYYSFLLANQNN